VVGGGRRRGSRSWKGSASAWPATNASTPGAHLLELAGEVDAALAEYRAAAGRTTSVPERHYLTTQAARLSGRRAGD
jgi:hypothetical protein